MFGGGQVATFHFALAVGSVLPVFSYASFFKAECVDRGHVGDTDSVFIDHKWYETKLQSSCWFYGNRGRPDIYSDRPSKKCHIVADALHVGNDKELPIYHFETSSHGGVRVYGNESISTCQVRRC